MLAKPVSLLQEGHPSRTIDHRLSEPLHCGVGSAETQTCKRAAHKADLNPTETLPTCLGIRQRLGNCQHLVAQH